MPETQRLPLDHGHRIQLPPEWVAALGLRGFVTLERKPDGILIRPCLPTTWDEIFATKLVPGQLPPETGEVEVSTSDLLF
jgi:hypothetical protein